jgi:ComF family protein
LPCGQCRDDTYDQAIAAGVYEKALAATVVQLKKRPDLPRRVRELLESLLMRVPVSENTVIIPVPLSRKRRYERGHNQAEVIGRVLADHSDLPIVVTALIRTDNSRMHRVGMDKRAREATVKSSFHVRTPRLIAGKDVLLVDDVFTSGSTASYCAKKLKENGAVSVKVITLARAVLLS